MSAESDLLNQVLILVIGSLLTAGLLGIFKYFRDRMHCIDKINERTERQSKAILLIAQKLDNKFQNSHSSPENTNFAEEVETTLQDSQGNL